MILKRFVNTAPREVSCRLEFFAPKIIRKKYEFVKQEVVVRSVFLKWAELSIKHDTRQE